MYILTTGAWCVHPLKNRVGNPADSWDDEHDGKRLFSKKEEL